MARFPRFLFFLGIASLFQVCPLSALQPPPRPQGYVSDYAGMLSPGMRQRLEAELRDFESRTSNQVIVAVFPSLEGDDLESFSIHLAEAWKPGQKGRDNGVILLIFKNDRKARIEVGYGLEGALPDAVAKLIIENELVPRFRAGNFDGGVEQAVSAIMLATQGEYKAVPKSEEGPGILFLIVFFLFVFFILPRIAFTLNGPVIWTTGRSSRWGNSGWGGGGFGGGGGGGFSGGGGGFGGGGASGSW